MPELISIGAAAAGGLLPALAWLWFWRREDSAHPEPRFLIAASFVGGILAVIIAIFGEKFIADTVNDQNMRYTLWAALEEIIKFGTVITIALNTKYYDEPIDAMIYMVVAALGFAAIENVFAIFSAVSGMTGQIMMAI